MNYMNTTAPVEAAQEGGKANFLAQYKRPEWQKKRLAALSAAGFTCQCCGDAESQLHVHHRQYIKGRRVWEYEVSELDVLCDSCHEAAHSVSDTLKSVLLRIPAAGIESIIGLIAGYCDAVGGPASADMGDIIQGQGPSFEVVGGRIAALACNKLKHHELLGLMKDLESRQNHVSGGGL